MVEKTYLISGDQERCYLEFDKKVFEEATVKKIFLINLTSRDEDIVARKKGHLETYFLNIGYEKVVFASDFTSTDDIRSKINSFGVLFVCGGDTDVLFDEVNRRELADVIKDFGGIVVANSAGAYLLSREYVRTKDMEFAEGLSFVDIACKAHFVPELEEELREKSRQKEFFAISDGSVIVVENDNLNTIGNVYLFKDGERRNCARMKFFIGQAVSGMDIEGLREVDL
jgi:peptidase E